MVTVKEFPAGHTDLAINPSFPAPLMVLTNHAGLFLFERQDGRPSEKLLGLARYIKEAHTMENLT